MKEIQKTIKAMVSELEPFDSSAAEILEGYLGSDFNADEFANDLDVWGGSGSVMDQALVDQGRVQRRGFEELAIELGQALENMQAITPKVERWVSVFRQWKESGI